MISLEQLSEVELRQLYSKLYAEAYEWAQRIQKQQARLNKAHWRRQVLDAATGALGELLENTQATITHLVQTNANPSIIDAQELMLGKYQEELARLPKYSQKIPTGSELQLEQMKLVQWENKQWQLDQALTAITAALAQNHGA